ncbi:hypothetical protein AURDEDRAFT_168904 [Auricularia subglabra TFB-10046 SS5]|nr:hypothetical protein AURDEDRAFT_168904 [Auricularia subglabra TFB-10046 SS5]
MLQATCFDATAHTHLAGLAESAIIFGIIMKQTYLPSSRHDGVPVSTDAATALANTQWQLTEAAPVQCPWGNVLSSWRSPTRLDPFFATASQSLIGVDHAGDAHQLASLASDLTQRVLESDKPHPQLADAGAFWALGELHKHGNFFVQHETDTKLVEAYLFERTLVFSAPGRVSEGAALSLDIEGVVRLGDVVDLSHTSTARDGKSFYCLDLKAQSSAGDREEWRLIFDDPGRSLVAAWSALLCRLVSQAHRASSSPDTGLLLATGTFAFGNSYMDGHPVPDVDTLREYAPVTIQGGECTADCSAYLFDTALFFIYKNPDGALRIHERIDLSEISGISDRSSAESFAVGVTVLNEVLDNVLVSGFDYGRTGRTRLDYVFSLRTREQVRTWLRALEERVFALRPSLFAAVPLPDDSTPPPEPTWHLAGVVFLTMSTEEAANEYNIGVAVLPQFASDGVATHAVAQVLQTAFKTLRAHRVQARILCTEPAAPAVRKFVHLGFAHEGMRRRAALHPTTGVWTDVAVLALLDVGWDIRASVRPQQQSLWEEMLNRHQSERERLLVWDGGLKRSRSMETVRDLRALADAAPTPSVVEDDAQSATASSHTDFGSHNAGSWDAMSDLESVGGRVHRWQGGKAANADDAADEDGSESWDDMEDEDEADLYTDEAEATRLREKY